MEIEVLLECLVLLQLLQQALVRQRLQHLLLPRGAPHPRGRGCLEEPLVLLLLLLGEGGEGGGGGGGRVVDVGDAHEEALGGAGGGPLRRRERPRLVPGRLGRGVGGREGGVGQGRELRGDEFCDLLVAPRLGGGRAPVLRLGVSDGAAVVHRDARARELLVGGAETLGGEVATGGRESLYLELGAPFLFNPRRLLDLDLARRLADRHVGNERGGGGRDGVDGGEGEEGLRRVKDTLAISALVLVVLPSDIPPARVRRKRRVAGAPSIGGRVCVLGAHLAVCLALHFGAPRRNVADPPFSLDDSKLQACADKPSP
mmetsp:Transcript_3239/g.6446  ORF Transcript_3239/g.6446 Transcript_3239/m.6446 type:complete len:315 (-) Transcript_3239:129-1073(-)